MQRFWLAVVALCLGLTAEAQAPNCNIIHYSRELSSRYVEAIAQDQAGYIYLGTRNGLCRYDGHEFRFFKSYPGDACRLSHNRINTIAVSAQNNIWCLAHDLKVYLFDSETGHFHDPFAALKFDTPPLLNHIYTLPNGITYLVGAEWVIRVDERQLHIDHIRPQHFRCMRLGSEELAGEQVIDVVMDGEGNEWLLTDQTVKIIGQQKHTTPSGAVALCVTRSAVWLIEESGTLSRYANGAIEPRLFRLPATHGRPRNIQPVNDDLIGISTDLGLSLYDAARNRFEFIAVEGGKVNHFRQDSHGAYWIFTDHEGVFRYEPERGEMTHLMNRKEDLPSENENLSFWHEDSKGHIFVVPERGVLSYYNPESNRLELLSSTDSSQPYKGRTRHYLVDHQRNIWCVEVGGVSRISVMPGTFSHHRFDTQTDARAFLYDDRERIWVSTRDYEVILHDNRLNRLGYLRSDGSIVPTPSRFEAPIYTFEMDEEGVIWMGSRFSGLYRLTPQGNRYQVERFTHRPEDSYSISDDNIYDIHRDRHGRLWIATYGGGLNLVEEQGNKLRFLHAGNRLNYPLERHSQLRVIEETPEGIFLGSTNGLVHFPHRVEPLDSIPFTCYEVPENGIDGLLSSDVRDIHYTSNGELYLLSFSGGLSRLKRDEQGEIRFENFTEKEGLPSAQVLSMIEDADGSQWILSETVVFRFDPATGYFEHYGERYSNEKFYFSEAKPILHGDHLLVGTSNGFCLVPTRETQSPFVPPLMLSELIVEGKPHTEGLGQLDRIELGPDERDLQLSFVALDYVNPGAIRYAYRLDGELENWQHLGKQRHLHFVDLHRGEHTLRIRSTNSNGRWVENDYVLHIDVTPTFWETGWAWMLYLMGVVLVAYLWVRMVKLRQRVVMEQQLSDIKLRFFTDISHELRTPLTLIATPIEMLLSREKFTNEGHAQMLVVRNNTQRLLTLVNQILDFRKLESKKMRLVLEHTDALEVIRETMSHFDLLSEEHHIDYSLSCNEESIPGWVDRDKLQKMLFNLLSNAFKYTPDGNPIMVRVSKVERQLQIEVIDGGVGIADADKERLFQRFENVSKINLFKPSTGLGLALVSELVQLLGGKINMESTPGVGSRFTLLLPLEKEAFHHMKHVDFLLGEQLKSPNNELEKEDDPLDSEEMEEETKRLILIVEDNEELRVMLRTILSEEYLIIEAANGEEGLHLAREKAPDLIVSDVLMPVMDGLEMVRRLREDATTAHLQILMLSAKASLDDRIEGLEQGADDYLPKPFHASYLLARVKSLIERRTELQQRLLAELAVASDRPEDPDEQVSPEIRFLNEATAIIERHIDDGDWSIEDFASEMCLSHTSLFQRMKSVVGLSPVEFIREVRLKRACQLIDEGNHNITSISYMVGFSDPKYFTRVFKKRFGVPPSQYGEQTLE